MELIKFYVLCFIGFKFICGERLHEQIYSSIEGGAACFRRLNGTHQAGCSSSEKGTVGVVHIIKNINDAQWLVFNSTAGPYIGVVNTLLFNNVMEIFMKQSDNVAGILLYEDSSNKPTSFTQESRCPNEYSSLESNCSSQQSEIAWNEKGTGLLRRDIPFPVFYLPDARSEEIVKIEQCFQRYNSDINNQKGNPLCSIQLNSFMFAAVNTVVCLRRSAASTILATTKVCDPMGDYNVYYSLFPLRQEKRANKSISFVTARIDAASLFDGVAPGAASSVVGMVTLITAAKVLADMIPVNDSSLYDKNVLWTLFNGESFDYIGSQRVAYDLSRGGWPASAPLTPAQIRLHVEIGQIGGVLANKNDTWPLFAVVPEDVLVSDVNEFLVEMSNKINVSVKVTTKLPPSSLHSFRKILNANVTGIGVLPEVLLVDFAETYNNMFYQSVLDDFEMISFKYHNISIDNMGTFVPTDELLANGTMLASDPQVKITRLSTALARTLYQQVVGYAYNGSVSASAHLVDEMLYCFLKSQACRLLQAADFVPSSDEEEKGEQQPASLYVGVVAWTSSAATYAGHLLALLTGAQQEAANRTQCDTLQTAHQEFSYYWLRGWNDSGVCIQTTMNFSQAVSPAFVVSDYDFTSSDYSTWTESVWQAMSARVFVVSGGGGAQTAALTGGLATLIAVFLTYWLDRNKQLVFTPSVPIVNNDATTGILRTVNC